MSKLISGVLCFAMTISLMACGGHGHEYSHNSSGNSSHSNSNSHGSFFTSNNDSPPKHYYNASNGSYEHHELEVNSGLLGKNLSEDHPHRERENREYSGNEHSWFWTSFVQAFLVENQNRPQIQYAPPIYQSDSINLIMADSVKTIPIYSGISTPTFHSTQGHIVLDSAVQISE